MKEVKVFDDDVKAESKKKKKKNGSKYNTVEDDIDDYEVKKAKKKKKRAKQCKQQNSSNDEDSHVKTKKRKITINNSSDDEISHVKKKKNKKQRKYESSEDELSVKKKKRNKDKDVQPDSVGEIEVKKKKKKKNKRSKHQDSEEEEIKVKKPKKQKKSRASVEDEIQNSFSKIKKCDAAILSNSTASLRASTPRESESNRGFADADKRRLGQWGSVEMADSQRLSKFARLLGGKKSADVGVDGAAGTAGRVSMAMTSGKERQLNASLMRQFDAARELRQQPAAARSGGLGYTAPPGENKKFYIDNAASKSMKFY